MNLIGNVNINNKLKYCLKSKGIIVVVLFLKKC